MNPEDIPLRDLHLPPPVGWWPPAPGWWLLMAVAAAGLLWFAWRAFREWRRAAARRIALSELKRLAGEYERDGDLVTLAKRLSALTRRAMLAYAPRDDVAGLTGERWLRWLDRGMSTPVFSEGAGRSLESLPYQRSDEQHTNVNAIALIEAVKQRLATPLPEERA